MVGRDIWGMGGRWGKREGFRADRTTRCAAFFHCFVLQPGRSRLTEARLHPTHFRPDCASVQRPMYRSNRISRRMSHHDPCDEL